MNVNDRYGGITSSPVRSLHSVEPETATSEVVDTGASASASISGPGKFFSHMQHLSTTSSTRFQHAAAEVAGSFKTSASQATGAEAQLFANLAQQFAQAAQTGSLSAPPGTAPVASAGPASSAYGIVTSGASPYGESSGTNFSASLLQSGAVQDAFHNALEAADQAASNLALESSTS